MQKRFWDYGKYMMCILSFLAVTAIFSSNPTEAQAAGSLPVPEGIKAEKETETSIRIKWDACKGVDGYYIYRYNKKKGKYKKVKEVIGAKKRVWVDKKVKTGRLYQYKIASYKKKKKSKKSYMVSAMAYGRDTKIVNVGDIDMYASAGRDMNICMGNKITAEVDGDFTKSYYFGCSVVSEQVVWSSSDPTIASVDQEGNVTTYEKEGVCEIIARAHNGVTGKTRLTVTNYARPKSFPYYDGSHPEVNRMLTEYRENVFNITHYFTVHKKPEVWGDIIMDDEGAITGYPDFPEIESIHGDVENILKNFPFVVEVKYSSWGVNFLIRYDRWSCWCRIDYGFESDESDVPHRLASHWSYTHFAADEQIPGEPPGEIYEPDPQVSGE